MALTDFAQNLIALVPQVDRLRVELDGLTTELRGLEGRVEVLEREGDLTAEKARNAALQATIEVTQRLSKEVGQLEARMNEADIQRRGRIGKD